jgi:ribosomal-protein-serine acetyltransferase
MTGIVLRTDRLELRPSEPAFFDEFWASTERSLEELAPWMPWALTRDPNATRAFLARARDSWRAGTDRAFTVFIDGEACGHCALDHFDPLVRSCEIGYWLRSDLCGRGLMTEAAGAVVDYGFDELGVHRIELHAGIGNHASNRIAAKLGFRYEGVLREAGFGADGHFDMNVYGLLATDPRSATG